MLFFLHRGSSHFRQPEHPLHPAQLPEQPPVFRCRSRCIDRKRDERREHETNEDRRQIHSRRTFLKNSAASIAGRTGRVKENKTG